MGLDFLDIIFRIEKQFEVELSRDEFEEIVRDGDIAVEDLYQLVLKKLRLRDYARNSVRLNYALWTDLRDAIHAVTGVPLAQIELKTRLETLFPRKTRRIDWEALRDATPYAIGSLGYPRAVRRIGLLVAIAMALFEQFHIWQIPGVQWLWPLLGIVAIWMFVETHAKVLSTLAPLRKSFPSGMATVKDLCRTVLGANYADLCRNVEVPMDDRCLAVWEQLQQILVDSLGVKPEEVTFRARLVKDLAME